MKILEYELQHTSSFTYFR